MALLGLSPEDEAALAGILFSMPDQYGRAPMAGLGQYLMQGPERKRQMALQEAQRKQLEAQTAKTNIEGQGLQDANLALQNQQALQQAKLLSGPLSADPNQGITKGGLDALRAATETQNQALLGGAAVSGDPNLLKFAQQNAGMSPIDETWYGTQQPVMMPDGSARLMITSNLGNKKFLDLGEGANPLLSGTWLDTGSGKQWASSKNVVGGNPSSVGIGSAGSSSGGNSPTGAGGLPKTFTKTLTPEHQPENITASGMAGDVPKLLATSMDKANAAVQKTITGNQLLQALNSGAIAPGPTADWRLWATQLADVAHLGGATTEEKLANTRQLVKGLASLTVQSRKALQGQGQITDFETRLLAKAESGELSQITAPEIKRLVELNYIASKMDYDRHTKLLARYTNTPSTAPYADIYQPYSMPELIGGGTMNTRPPLSSFQR